MKKIFISTLCVAMMLVLSACESPEQRAANEMSAQPTNDTTSAKYAKVLTSFYDSPSIISGEISDYTTYAHGFTEVVFKEPVTVYIGGEPITTNTVCTHFSNVYIFHAALF